MRNSFIFVGKTPHFVEPATIFEYSPLQAFTNSAQQRQEHSFPPIGSDAFAGWSLNDEYIGSTSPYDDDGNQL